MEGINFSPPQIGGKSAKNPKNEPKMFMGQTNGHVSQNISLQRLYKYVCIHFILP